MIHRQTKLPLTSRLIAASCVVIWLAGVSACNLDALFCCDSHDCETEAHAGLGPSLGSEDAASADHMHVADTLDSPIADGHSHDSSQHDRKEGSCCSTLYAVVQTAQSAALGHRAIQPTPLLCLVVPTFPPSHTRSENPPSRHARNCVLAFTPEVCLGPAHRSLAPPAFRLI